MSRKRTVRVRRVYDPPSPDDGTRVLVDRLWPRGLSREEAHIDDWPKDVTPSPELRRWFHGFKGREEREKAFPEFRARYEAELAEDGPVAEALTALRERAKAGPLTLLTAAREPERSHAVVLADELRS